MRARGATVLPPLKGLLRLLRGQELGCCATVAHCCKAVAVDLRVLRGAHLQGCCGPPLQQWFLLRCCATVAGVAEVIFSGAATKNPPRRRCGLRRRVRA